jgi:hypothetical protein
MYHALDIAFTALHSALVLFNLTGWIWRRTLRLHLLSIGATMLSWFGLGVYYGWGYCPCTDWHWDIKAALGETGLPASWIQYHLELLTGMNWSPDVADGLTVIAGLSAFILSIILNLRLWLRTAHDDASG